MGDFKLFKDPGAQVTPKSTTAFGPNCYLALPHKIQECLYRTGGPTVAASLELVAHHGYVASLSLFCWYCFG